MESGEWRVFSYLNSQLLTLHSKIEKGVKKMQEMLGLMRKAITDYKMIEDGDRILVGVSGGKDSVVMLVGLARLREFMGIDFEIIGLTLDSSVDGSHADYSEIERLAKEYNFEYYVKYTDIADIVFNIRKESNPCSLCARMRRGALHDFANEHNCNKVALGHHADDAMQTLIMNLFNEGRIGCFSPVTYLSRKDITVIRPMVYASERKIKHTLYKNNLPIVKSVCPVDKVTNREKTKEWLNELEKEMPGVKKRIYGSLKNSHISGW